MMREIVTGISHRASSSSRNELSRKRAVGEDRQTALWPVNSVNVVARRDQRDNES